MIRTVTFRLSLLLIVAAAIVAGCPTPPPTDGGPVEGEGEQGEGEGEEGEGEGEEGEGEGEGEGEADPIEGTFVVEPCDGAAPQPNGSETCTVTPGSGGTIVYGAVLTPGRVYEGGAVAFDADGAITCVGCGCVAGTATVVACGDAAVSPGLINAHDHAGWMNDQPWYLTASNSAIADEARWEHRHDWRKGKRGNDKVSVGGSANGDAKALGELRFALSGATATLASGGFSSGSGGMIRNLDDGGDMDALGVDAVRYVTFPLGDSGGTQLASGCAYGTIADRPQGPHAPHVAEGIDAEARNEFLCLTSTDDGGKDTIDDNAAVIHGVGLLPLDVAVMAERGASLIWSPRSNISLYGDTAPVTLMKRLGVNIALGTDWVPSGSMNMLRELRCVLDLNDRNYGGAFSHEEIWRMVTVNAARALHVEGVLGSLAVGRRADLAVFKRRGGPFGSVVAADIADVALVLKDGRPLNGDAAVVAALASGCDVLDVCGTSKQVCATREAGKSLSALQADQNGVRYPLFFCDTPNEEPTCTPSRTASDDVIAGSTLYTGTPGDGDADGDSIPDATDSCPTVFNPARPLDRGQQADGDEDGVGDVCDPCPLDANTTTCSVFNPNDRDGDGVDVAVDNCPEDPNPGQEDGDQDGTGDLCDACPAVANADGAGCPATIYALKTDPAFAADQRVVSLSDVVVTAVAGNGFWMQVDPASTGYGGVEHSCVFAFVGTATKPSVGDLLAISSATVSSFFGQVQVKNVAFTVAGTGRTVAPTPIADPAAAIVDGPAAPLEGCVVEVRNVDVTDPAPAPGPGDSVVPSNEFEITGGIRVDDALFGIDPLPQSGERFAFVRGALAWRNSLMKLLPRSVDDVGFASVDVAGFVDADVFARLGSSQPAAIAPLVVRLTRTAAADTAIDLVVGDTAVLAVPATVMVPAGQGTAVIPLTGVAAGTSTVTASLVGGASVTASVRVLADDQVATPVAIDPSTATLVIDRTQTFTVRLDLPAPVTGVTLEVVIDGNVGTAPATVAVPPHAQEASVTLTASSTAASGSLQVALQGGAGRQTATVVVVDVPPLGLVLNEIDYNNAGADAAEFVELFNSTGAAVDLDGAVLVFVNGSRGAEYRSVELAGVLPSPGYAVIGPQSVLDAASTAAVRVLLSGTDLVQNGDPDGVVLLDAAGAVIDSIAYGCPATAPETGMCGVTGIPVRDQTAFAAEDTTRAKDATGGTTSLCREPTSGAWAACATATPGAVNNP